MILNHLYHILLSSGIHAILFIIFMTIIYFVVIIKLERDIFTNFVTNGAKKYSIDHIPVNEIPKFNMFMKILKNEADKEQESFKKYNNQLKFKSVKVIVIITISFIVFMLAIPMFFKVKNINLDYYKLAKETLLIIIIVGLYEFMFMNYIVLEYSFYGFNKTLHNYVLENSSNIKKFMPSILLHFMIGAPPYDHYIPNHIKSSITNKVTNYIDYIDNSLKQKTIDLFF
jgi:hypothetical protein